MVSSQPNRAFDTQYSPKIAEGLPALLERNSFYLYPCPPTKGNFHGKSNVFSAKWPGTSIQPLSLKNCSMDG